MNKLDRGEIVMVRDGDYFGETGVVVEAHTLNVDVVLTFGTEINLDYVEVRPVTEAEQAMHYAKLERNRAAIKRGSRVKLMYIEDCYMDEAAIKPYVGKEATAIYVSGNRLEVKFDDGFTWMMGIDCFRIVKAPEPKYKFIITTASAGDLNKPCEGAIQEEVEYPNGKHTVWTIGINSIEELLELSKLGDFGNGIILNHASEKFSNPLPTINIYDSYLE